MKNMTTIKVEPLVEVGGAKFGDSRKQVRNALSAFQDRKVVAPYKEFKKYESAKTTTDDFGYCHAYYDDDYKLIAVEIFDDVEVVMNGKIIFPISPNKVYAIASDMESDDANSFISRSKSIAVVVEEGKMKSILFGKEGYYPKK